jgi:hypothetical protein
VLMSVLVGQSGDSALCMEVVVGTGQRRDTLLVRNLVRVHLYSGREGAIFHPMEK